MTAALAPRAGVDLLQAPHTRLADIDLPDLEEAVLGVGGARGAAAEVDAAAASSIERAAEQIERAAEQLLRLAASKELSSAQARVVQQQRPPSRHLQQRYMPAVQHPICARHSQLACPKII